MSARCRVTGAVPGFGESVSHSHRRTYHVPSPGRTVSLTVSAKGVKTIDRRGIESVVAQIRARGERI